MSREKANFGAIESKIMAKHILSVLAVFMALAGVCRAADRVIPLDGTWSLAYWRQPAVPVTNPDSIPADAKTIEAAVPGNVELDLQHAGIIPDPMIGCNTDGLRRWEGYEWCYSRRFGTPHFAAGERVVLQLCGVDCLASVWVNGRLVGSPENALIEHAYDITGCLAAGGDNELRVVIRSAVLEGQRRHLGMISIGNFPSEESVYLRKAPHSFGWDILPRLVSAGLWRSVNLVVRAEAGIRDVHHFVTGLDVASRRATLYTDVQVRLPMEMMDKTQCVVTLERGGKKVAESRRAVSSPALRLTMGVGNADFWWPRGYGDAALYDATVSLVDSTGKIIAADRRKIGLRQVKLEYSGINAPESPGKFQFVVNGVPVFVRGTNWVPADALHSRDASWYDRLLSMAADLDCNMVRCWGGGVYEDSRFYDICDSLGIMVWQDFVMACTFYPQRGDFAQAVAQEVEAVVTKLRNHPCVALWAGNNEDDAATHWSLAALNYDPNRDYITRTVIPRVLYEFDLTRTYLPSSPYYSEEVYRRGCRESELPEAHLWGPRGYYKDAYYKDARNIFVSEIGYHGCPNLESLRKMMTKDCVYPWTDDKFHWNEEWITKSVRRFPADGYTDYRDNLMLNQIRCVFGDVPLRIEDFIFASQSVQAEAMKFFVEMWRGRKFCDKTGIIWWNLRDGWPVISDAVTDYYCSKKLAYYYLRNVGRSVCVMINDSADGGCPLVAVNDTRRRVEGRVAVSDVATGQEVYSGSFAVDPNGRTEIAKLRVTAGQGMLLIRYDVDGAENANHYLYGAPPFKLGEYRKWVRKAGVGKPSGE